MAAIAPISVLRGNSVMLRIPVFNADGTAIDLTGYRIDWRLSNTVFDSPDIALVSKSTVDESLSVSQGNTVNNPSGVPTSDVDIIVIPIMSSDTNTLLGGTYYHETGVFDTDGNIITTTTGDFVVVPTLIPTLASAPIVVEAVLVPVTHTILIGYQRVSP